MDEPSALARDWAEESLPARVARVAAMHPNRPAIISSCWQPTYAELDASANRLAHALHRQGGRDGDRVAILMRHDAPLISAMLSVLKAARIVVVLNPTHPPAHLRELMKDCEPTSILTDGSNHALAAEIAGTSSIFRFEQASADGSKSAAGPSVAPDETAFLIYTSGSTGRPKGVMRTHRQIAQNTIRHTRAMGFAADDRITLLASLSGGQGVTTAWCALLHGAALCPFPVMEKGFAGLADWIVAREITMYISSASIFRQFVQTLDPGMIFPQVRAVRLGSEPATAEDFRAYQQHFSAGCALVHTFSSSETGNIAQLRLGHDDAVDDGHLPIGKPAEDVEIFLVNEHGEPVCDGEIGEIMVRSRCLSAGYWRNPVSTAELFSQSETDRGLRTFRTGDLAKRSRNGTLQFMGRNDPRLKIRGNRIETSEVADVLLRQPAVEQVALCAVDGKGDNTQMIAYVVIRRGRVTSARDLRRAMRAVLPEHAVPSRFVFVDRFPLTPHGKIDLERLRHNDLPNRVPPAFERPRTETETLLAGIWEEVFEQSVVGRQDDFFDLGGDSLAAAVISAQLYAALGIEVHLQVFAEYPTLARMAAALDSKSGPARATDPIPFAPGPRELPLPLSHVQERIWRFSQTPQGSAGYTVAKAYRISGPLDRNVLRECMTYIAARHEILRTSFAAIGEQLVQIVHPPARVALPFVDFADKSDPEREATRLFKHQAKRIFDLAAAPLTQFYLIRIRQNEHWLVRVGHHIISDSWTWRLYFRELAILYEARRAGRDAPLPPSHSLQYGDYAAWERKALCRGGANYRTAVQWWMSRLSQPPPPIELPFERAQAQADTDPAEGRCERVLKPGVLRRLSELGRSQRASLYTVGLAAFVALLADEIRQPDVVVGTYVSNRNRVALQNMLGHFANLATLRFRCKPEDSFRGWLSTVRRNVAETEAYCDLPYEEMRDQLRGNGVELPGIKVIFSMSQHRSSSRFADLELTNLRWAYEAMPWGFTMHFDERTGGCDCVTLFDANKYDPEGVQRFVKRYLRLLDAVSRLPDSSVCDLLTTSAQLGEPVSRLQIIPQGGS